MSISDRLYTTISLNFPLVLATLSAAKPDAPAPMMARDFFAAWLFSSGERDIFVNSVTSEEVELRSSDENPEVNEIRVKP